MSLSTRRRRTKPAFITRVNTDPQEFIWELNGGSVCLTTPDVGVLRGFKRAGYDLLSLAALYVPPEGRGRGTGHALMRTLSNWADRNSVDIWAYVQPYGPEPRLRRAPLLEFYAAHGFNRVAPNSPDYEVLRRAR